MKKILSIILIVCCLFSSLFVTAFANDASSLVTTKFEETLNNYFEVRESDFFPANSRATNLTSVIVSERVNSDSITRKEQIVLKMQKIDKIYAVEVQTTPHIIEKNIKTNGNIEATVYEWTWIEYNSTGEGPATDELGYATIHDMLFVPTENGYRIERDTYFEGNTTGAISSDYILESTEDVIVSDNIPSNEVRKISLTYKPNNAATYADTYVQNTANSVIGQNTSYYNLSVYGYISWNDCANYVSQCLYAGGFEETSSWYYNRPCVGNNVANHCPATWRSVSSLTNYLTNTQGYTSVTATNSNVKKGNPVYVLNDTITGTNHIVICVGTNSSGTPIINGHTNDMYHCPWTWVNSTGSTAIIKTIRIT